MEHCRSPDGVTSISVRPYYTMLLRIYLALAMGFLVVLVAKIALRVTKTTAAQKIAIYMLQEKSTIIFWVTTFNQVPNRVISD